MDDIPPFFNTIVKDGLTYYVIPANTRLFRGDIPADYTNPLSHMNGPIFFGESIDVARMYGLPFEYRTTNELQLLALDKSMQTIYETAANDNAVRTIIPPILKKNYGYPNGYRDSDDNADKKLTEYICDRYGGYALDFMPTEGEGRFHREIVLCDKTQVEFVEMVPISKTEENSIRDEQNMRKAAPKRKKRQRVNTEGDNNVGSSLHMGSLFGDEPNSTGLNTEPIVENNNQGNNVSNSSKPVVNKILFDFDDEVDDVQDDEVQDDEVQDDDAGYRTPGGKRQDKKKTMRRNKKNSKKRYPRRKTNSKRHSKKRNNKTRRK